MVGGEAHDRSSSASLDPEDALEVAGPRAESGCFGRGITGTFEG
jgi:hypothetical protein